MLWNRSHIEEGMTVRSAEGDKLGKIIAIGEDTFEIEKGFFILKDYLVPYADIQDIRDGECFLRYGKEELQSREAGAAREGLLSDTPEHTRSTASGWVPPMAPETRRDRQDDSTTEGFTASQQRGAGGTGAESESVTRVPLARERLDVRKHDVESGEVHIHKGVETETETIEVPVRRETVQVERVQHAGVPASDASFQEEDITVPLHAEEVEVNKEVVTDEEVVVTRTPVEERRRVSGKVRREHAEVRADEDADEAERGRGWTPDADEPTRY